MELRTARDPEHRCRCGLSWIRIWTPVVTPEGETVTWAESAGTCASGTSNSAHTKVPRIP
jgi:hypothetical protein